MNREMPVLVGYNGKNHSSEALHWAAEEALNRAAAPLALPERTPQRCRPPSVPCRGSWVIEMRGVAELVDQLRDLLDRHTPG